MITYYRLRAVDNTHSIGYTYDSIEEALRDLAHYTRDNDETKYYLLLCVGETTYDKEGFLTETVTTTRLGIYTHDKVLKIGITGI